MAKKFGRAIVRANGRMWDTKRGASLETGGVKREPRPGSNSAGGYTEELVGAKLDCTILYGAGDSVADINALTDATVTFETDTGQTYIVRNAYSEGNATLTEGEGELKTVIYGEPAEEMLS